MVLLAQAKQLKAFWKFKAEILGYSGDTQTLAENFKPSISIGHIRQAAHILIEESQ